jgi:hypothetical protein
MKNDSVMERTRTALAETPFSSSADIGSADDDQSDHFERSALAGALTVRQYRWIRSSVAGVVIVLLLSNVVFVWRLESTPSSVSVPYSTAAILGAPSSQHVSFQKATPLPVGFSLQAQPWRPSGPYFLGDIRLTNMSATRHWYTYAMLIGRDRLTCADSPYQDSTWLLDLPPGVSVTVPCAIPVQAGVSGVPIGEFSTYLPDELGTPDTVLLHVQTVDAFQLEPATTPVPAQAGAL